MAVEPTNENKDAAEPQNPAPGPMLTDEDLESPSKKRKVCCKTICTLMCMFSIVPNMYRVSHSRYVSERVSPSYSTTGIGPFYKNMESLPVAPVPPNSLPRRSGWIRTHTEPFIGSTERRSRCQIAAASRTQHCTASTRSSAMNSNR